MLEFIFNNILLIIFELFFIGIFIWIQYYHLKINKEQDPQKAWKKISWATEIYARSYHNQTGDFPKRTPIKIPKVLKPYNIKYNPKTGKLIKPNNL